MLPLEFSSEEDEVDNVNAACVGVAAPVPIATPIDAMGDNVAAKCDGMGDRPGDDDGWTNACVPLPLRDDDER